MKQATQILGMLMLVAGLLALNYFLFDLARYGTCASGGPYVSARECAPDTGIKMVGMMVAIFGGLIGAGLARSARIGLAAWGLLFTSLAFTFVLTAYGPAAADDNGFGITAVILGIVFAAMGIPALVMAVGPDGPVQAIRDNSSSS